MNVGPIGVIGSASANALAGEADVVVAIGTRLQDFTTGSWTVFSPDDADHRASTPRRFDATKHRALAVVGDAREAVAELGAALGDWRAPSRPGCDARRKRICRAGTHMVDKATRPTNTDVPSYAQVVGAVNRMAGRHDLVAHRRRRPAGRALPRTGG